MTVYEPLDGTVHDRQYLKKKMTFDLDIWRAGSAGSRMWFIIIGQGHRSEFTVMQ